MPLLLFLTQETFYSSDLPPFINQLYAIFRINQYVHKALDRAQTLVYFSVD